MNAFESLVGMLLRRQGYWTAQNVKVGLTASDKVRIARTSSPRWDIDVVAFKGSTGEVLAVECKSFLDSTGVVFRNGQFEPAQRYKMFSEPKLRKVVLNRLRSQLVEDGLCPKDVTVTLGLAVGKLASRTVPADLEGHFERQGWKLFTPKWVATHLGDTAKAAYEDDIAFMVAKILGRAKRESAQAGHSSVIL